MVTLFEQLFFNALSRLVESDEGAEIKLPLSSREMTTLRKHKSVIHESTSETVMSNVFKIVFNELSRYISII